MSVGHLVVPPADAGGVDGVRHGVAPVLVVPGVGEARPDVVDVRDVAVVQRPNQPAGHQPADLVVAREVDVVVDAAAADLGDRLVGVVERRDLDLDAVLVLERLHRVGADVVGVGVELERRALLRREPVGDRLVVVGDVPLDRVVRRGERQAWAVRDDGPDLEHAARKAPSVGAAAARIAARVRNCRRVGPCPLGAGIRASPLLSRLVAGRTLA